jgi:hypothetical protein
LKMRDFRARNGFPLPSKTRYSHRATMRHWPGPIS